MLTPTRARRRRRAGPARPGGRGSTRTPTRWPAPGRRACPGWPACRRRRASAGRAARPAPPSRPPRSARRARRAPRRAARGRRPRWRRRSAPTAAGSLPATRVTSRTPCPESARCASGASASRPATRTASRCGRCEVRATARSCSSGCELDHGRPADLGEGDDQRHGGRVAPGVRGDGPRPAVEQRRAGRQRAGALAAGHRVRADVPRQGGGVHRAGQLAQRRRLHRADVGHHGLASRSAPRRRPRRGGRAGRRRRRAAARPPARRDGPRPGRRRCGRARARRR